MKRNIAIGFVTGRKQFQTVLRSYINNWLEHGLVHDSDIRLNLFIAYDLKYHGTVINDYKNIPPELAAMVGSIHFLGGQVIAEEIASLQKKGLLNSASAELLFGEGYGKKRNAVMYFAIKEKMDALIFLDDDEYPVATLRTPNNLLQWMGQSVLGTHLKHINKADITHGHHCGYISPIPHITFNETLTEKDFRYFIEAISNEIISWEKIRELIFENNGVTYADAKIINDSEVTEVAEEGGMKFISGANLCFNLKQNHDFPPFYNPPGARGEDTFMSTALGNQKVLKVPCYTFHDGFSMYQNLLTGVLPVQLEPIDSLSPVILKRFINATIGWIRYKPLMIYITNRENYESIMEEVAQKLEATIPKMGAYFQTNGFEKIIPEFNRYRRKAPKHFEEFEATKKAWKALLSNMH